MKLELKKTELIKKERKITLRYPNLNTVLMVEKVLEENKDQPMKISELRRKLPKQIMYPTLKIILEYLWRSGKIIYGPEGIQWIYQPPEQINKLMQDAIEV